MSFFASKQRGALPAPEPFPTSELIAAPEQIKSKMRRCAIVTTLMLLVMGCTQQLAQRSQNSWLKKNSAQPLYKASLVEVAGPLQGDVTTVLSGYLESSAIGELSGLAASYKNPGVFWAINDSGNRAELFAMDRTGRHIDTFRLPERNIDWEDMATFQHNGKSWIVIADTGDNMRRRNHSIMYVLEEPLLGAPRVTFAKAGDSTDGMDAGAQSATEPSFAAAVSRELRVEAKIEFAYEDGPQNVESIAVSEEDSSIYLVAKRGAESSLYELPLMLETPDVQLVAKRLGKTSGLHWAPGDSWLEQRLGSRFLLGPTAMDISSDNQLAVIANYRHVYLYRKPAGQPWSVALRNKPQIISSHRMAQSESVAFSADGNYVIVGSEGLHAPVLLVH